ncbi:MAG: hypothetical protein M3Y72_01545 [Acidobacteriota bacterium]|nr:hypothetical protein [Acidobacteriota bacterium]
MAFDLFNDIFLLYFALKSPQGTFQRLAILQMYFCQLHSPPSQGGPPRWERLNSLV